MPKLFDLARVQVASAPGTGTITLGSAIYGFLTFAQAGVQNGDVITYAINDNQQSEIGHGTYNSGANTLTRDLVFSSTNGGLGGSKINASATAQVFITVAAEDLGALVPFFQSVTGASATVGSSTTMLAVQRNNPTLTTLTLPAIAVRTAPLQVVDWSTSVVTHQILIQPNGVETIMRQASFSLYSTTDQLGGVTLYPSPDLSGWVIAP